MSKNLLLNPDEPSTQKRGPVVLLICGALLFLGLWVSLYLRGGSHLAEAVARGQQSVEFASQEAAWHIHSTQKEWDAQASRMQILLDVEGLAQVRSPLFEGRAISLLGPQRSVIFDQQSSVIAASAGTTAAQKTLDVADLAQLRQMSKGASKLLTSDYSNTKEQELRYASSLSVGGEVFYLVTHTPVSSLFNTGGIRALGHDLSAELRLATGEKIFFALGATAGTSPGSFKLSDWVYPLPSTISADSPLNSAGPFATVRMTVAGDSLLGPAEGQVVESALLGLLASIFFVALGVTCAVTFSKFYNSQKALITLVARDALTDLPNRRYLNNRLEELFTTKAEPKLSVGLIFVDLDNFKPVNDTYGHKMGDLLLQAVAGRLRAATGSSETICRLGGDEFAIITRSDKGSAPMRAVAEAVVNSFSEPFFLEGVQIHAAASVGLAYAKNCRSSSDLLKNADMAMYDAKKAGKGQYREFSSQMAKKALMEERLSLALKPALASKQFSLVYQPKVNTFQGSVTGYEALLRWQHPQMGGISPATFIPLAEANGLIHELGTWVLGEAIQQLKEWQLRGHINVSVAVNVSAIQLLDPYFIGRVKRLLDTHGVSPANLQIELTESVLARNVQHAKSVLNQLRALGVKIAIDDFGTGYSSLNSLQLFDIDCLKVDQSFVREMGTPAGAKICRSIVGLAHSLGMTVVAEGVETQEQFATLYEMGCDEMQGYFFAKPLTSAAAIAFTAEKTGLWADIDATRESLSGLQNLNLSCPTSAFQLLELELQSVKTGFGTLT